MTEIKVYDEDAKDLMRLASRIGVTTAEVVNVLLELASKVAAHMYEKTEEE